MSVSYLGVVVLTAGIAATLIGSGVGGDVASATKNAVCSVAGNDCDPKQTSKGAQGTQGTQGTQGDDENSPTTMLGTGNNPITSSKAPDMTTQSLTRPTAQDGQSSGDRYSFPKLTGLYPEKLPTPYQYDFRGADDYGIDRDRNEQRDRYIEASANFKVRTALEDIEKFKSNGKLDKIYYDAYDDELDMDKISAPGWYCSAWCKREGREDAAVEAITKEIMKKNEKAWGEEWDNAYPNETQPGPKVADPEEFMRDWLDKETRYKVEECTSSGSTCSRFDPTNSTLYINPNVPFEGQIDAYGDAAASHYAEFYEKPPITKGPTPYRNDAGEYKGNTDARYDSYLEDATNFKVAATMADIKTNSLLNKIGNRNHVRGGKLDKIYHDALGDEIDWGEARSVEALCTSDPKCVAKEHEDAAVRAVTEEIRRNNEKRWRDEWYDAHPNVDPDRHDKGICDFLFFCE